MAFHEYPYTDFHEMNLDWVIKKVKELATAWAQVQQDWTDEQAAFANLQSWIENYFNNLNVQTEINVKLDAMVEAGTMSELIAPFVASGLPAVVADQIGAVVASQIGPVVAAQIGSVVADQLPAVAAAAAASEVSAWLAAHVNPETGYVIDDSLTVQGAAADSKAVGDEVTAIKSAFNAITTNRTVVTSKNSDGVTTYQERGYYNPRGEWVANSGYVMYYFTVSEKQDIWLTLVTESYDFIEINVFSDSLFGTSVYFGRSSQQDEIPTINNKLSVNSGSIVSIVTAYSNSSEIDFEYKYYAKVLETDSTLKDPNKPANSKAVGDLLLPLNRKFETYCIYRPVVHQSGAGVEAVDNQIYYSDKVQDNVLSIFYPAQDGYLQFNIGRSYRNDPDVGFDVWRMCTMYAANDNFEKRFNLTNPGEWEMAVKISGAPDFIGGYEHGDEYQSEITIFIDGTMVDVTTLTQLTKFNELRIICVSDMFDPSDHITKVGEHGKEWIFKDGKAILNQSIKWLFAENTNMSMCYLAMFPAIRGLDANSQDRLITSKFFDNVNFSKRTCAVADFDNTINENATKVTLFSPESGFNMSLEIIDYPQYPDSKYCFISNGLNKSNKIYFGICGKGTTYGVVTPNQIWKSKSVYTFEMCEGTAN